MSLQHLRLKDVDEKVLAELVTSGLGESRTLEFKQDLQVETHEQKQEFLSDVTALANTDGGDIVYGIREENGVAKELMGLKNFVADDRIGQLENLLRDFVQPRLPSLQIDGRLLGNGNHALLVRVGRSWTAPHMVRHQGVTRFCGRNSKGKYDLDVQQLRSAFLGSEGMADRLRSFRLDRINKLVSGGAPVKLTTPHLMVLHLLPVVGARPDNRLGTADYEKLKNDLRPRPIGSRGWGSRFNMDGMMVAANFGDNKYHSYVQVFRNGFLEAVESQTLNPRPLLDNQEAQRIIPSIAWEERILEVFAGYLKALETLGLPAPYVASISLLHVKGFYMYVGPSVWSEGGHLVDRDHLLTDEVLIDDSSKPANTLLQPLFDQIWNGCGYARSLNFKPNGDWGQRG